MLDPVLYPDEIENFEVSRFCRIFLPPRSCVSIVKYAHKRLLGLEATEAGVRYLQFQSLEVSKGVWRAYGSPVSMQKLMGFTPSPRMLRHLIIWTTRLRCGATQEHSNIPKKTQLASTHSGGA